MGLRLVRIGDKVSVGEVKSLSFRRSMRNSAVILYVVALWVAFVILGRILDDIPEWVGLVFSTINVSFIGIIDKQLPTRKNKNMFLMFTFMAFGPACIGVEGVASGKIAIESGLRILVGMMLICLGVGLYFLYRWRRRVLWYKEIALQRELRAKRKKKLEY